MEVYLKPKDVQRILGFSRAKTYAMINQADFPKIRIGKDIRIPESEFYEFMKRLVYKSYDLV